MHLPTILSIQVGRPRRLVTRGQPWVSAIYKEAVDGPVQLGAQNIAGDEQAWEGHGGPDQAVLAYAAEWYPLWRHELERDDISFGGFGENLTVSGLNEFSVCIGDVYVLPDHCNAIRARVQVSQPRQPCSKLTRRWDCPDLAKRVQRTNRTGWYFRVLEEGQLQAPMIMRLEDRPHPGWTIARASEAMTRRMRSVDDAHELASLAALSSSWREALSS